MPGLSEVIDGRLTVTEIIPGPDYQVLAVDVFESWAAVFQFQVSPNGEFDTETERAQRFDGTRWDSLGSGGMRGIGWELPWRRPEGAWRGRHLLGMGLTGSDVEDVDDNEYFLIALSGFASAATTEIRLRSVGWDDRTIVPAATGAYVAIALGRGDEFAELTPMHHGTELTRPTSYPSPT